MAAKPIRVTWFYSSVESEVPVGWSETLWYRTPQDEYAAAITAGIELAKKRLPSLGGGYKIAYMRVSKEGIYRDSQIEQLDMKSPNPSKLTADNIGDFAYAVLLVRMQSGALHRRSMYISGLADSDQRIDKSGAKLFEAGPLALWASAVKENWAWYGYATAADTNKTGRVWIPAAPPVTTTGHWDYPLGRVLYPIDKVQGRRFGSHRRGRPFDLLRGRSKRPTPME